MVAALSGAVLRVTFMGLPENHLAYVTYYPAVGIAALLGGIASGALATVLSALLVPVAILGDWLGLTIFLTMAMFISCITEALHRTWIRLSDAEKRSANEYRLHDRNERFQLAISPDAVGTWDLDIAANVMAANPEIREIFGFAADTLLNQEMLYATVMSCDLPIVQAALKAALDSAGDGVYSAEYRIRRANDGEERWIHGRTQALIENGRSVRLIGICRDVTNEKLATQILLDKARLGEQLTSVAASLPGVICSFRQCADGKQSMPYTSANFFRVYGLAPEDVRTNAGPLLRRVHPDDISHLQASIAESARTLTVWRDDFRYEHPQKGIIWLGGQSSPNLESGGDILWHGYVQDVTERKLGELKLRASEARSRAIFDSGLLGVMYWSINGEITDANDKFLEMLGYCREDLSAGQLNWVNMTPPEFHSVVDTAFAELKETGSNRRPFEKEYFRKDGTRLPVLVAGVMVDSTRLNGVAFVLDVSERRDAEVRMQKSHADRLNVMKSMAAGLAHEINQPLAATVIYLKALRRLVDMEPDRRPADVIECCNKAIAQVTRAGQIVTGLRAFIAHNEPDKLFLKLHDLIQNAYDATSVGASERQIRVRLQLNSKEDEVIADKVQIEQVLVNLIRNAKEAIGASQRREIVISTSSNRIDVRVEIADTGVGLSDEVKASLFEPFRTTKANGTGVGLAISRTIIEAHHGTIWSASNPGGGAIFGFALPLATQISELKDE